MTHPNGREYSENFGTQSGMFSRDKTHCKQGHEFTPENTYWQTRKSRNPKFPYRQTRVCITCRRDTQERYRARQAIMKAYQEVLAEQEAGE